MDWMWGVREGEESRMIPGFGPEQMEEWCYFYEMEKMKEEQ